MFTKRRIIFGVVIVFLLALFSIYGVAFGQDPEDGQSTDGERIRFWSLAGNGGTSPTRNFLGTTDYQPLVIKTNRAEALRVDPSGNVGIGTTNPTTRLVVDGFVKQTNGHMMFRDGWGNAVFVVADGTIPPDPGPNRFVFRSVSDLDAYAGGPPTSIVDMMTIENTGHVGIGTTDPNSTLEVSNGYFELDTSAGTPPGIDCSAQDHVGRMKVDNANTNLYVCTAVGWVTK